MVGNLPRRKEYLLAAGDTHWDGEGEWHIIKERNQKPENSSRAQRGCGFDCGLNQFHKECEKYTAMVVLWGHRGAPSH